jgi:WD40 repeat protein
VEILYEIFVYLPSAKDFRNLCLCCRVLNSVIESDGWKIFIKNRFPSLISSVQSIIRYVDVAKGLTSLSRDWDRRALMARDLPTLEELNPVWPERAVAQLRRPVQTMNYVPVIDSHEEIVGGDWKCRQELVVYGAGTKIVSRFRTKNVIRSQYRQHNMPRDEQEPRSRWGLYQQAESLEGFDDITALEIRRSSEGVIKMQDKRPSFSVLVGTASGNLSLLDLLYRPYPIPKLLHGRKQILHTNNNSALRSATFFPSQRMILSASADGIVNVFDSGFNGDSVQPCTSLKIANSGPLWTAQCLSEENIVVGTGPSSRPLQFYRVAPTGLMEAPIARWDVGETDTLILESSRQFTSVTCIFPLTSPLSMKASGNLFLSGGFDGVIKLHDLRSSRSFEARFFDPIDQSAVYSLATLGQERILAGGARNTLLKVFDLRMSGGRNYSYRSAKQIHPLQRDSSSVKGGNWTVFLRPQDQQRLAARFRNMDSHMPRHVMRHARNRERAGVSSAVYSVSIPSPYSPTIYAGLEGRVVQVDVADYFDRRPDPIYGTPPVNGYSQEKVWNLDDTVLELAHYDHESPNSLRKQGRIGTITPSGEDTGLDSHWYITGQKRDPGWRR